MSANAGHLWKFACPLCQKTLNYCEPPIETADGTYKNVMSCQTCEDIIVVTIETGTYPETPVKRGTASTGPQTDLDANR